MVEQLRFVLGWIRYNKVITIVYMVVLSLIVCSNILLIQFFCEESTENTEGRYYYSFYFDKHIDNNTIEALLLDLSNQDIGLEEFMVASNSDKYVGYDDYYVAAYFLLNEKECNERNEYLSYGKFDGMAKKYIADVGISELPFNDENFKCTGEGTIHIGSYFCDYLIAADDYKEYVNRVDAIEVTLYEKNEDAVEAVVSKYIEDFEAEYLEDFLESGFESVKNTIIICIILLLFSLYSALVFIEIMIHMQKADIAVFLRCGAEKRDISRMYIGQVVIAGLISFIVGSLLGNVFLLFADFNFEKITIPAYLITFAIFMFCYIIEALIYIKVTLSNTISVIEKNL
ncbi:MAG: ABC transporter permease [Coprococcus sp.]|nr:ABC transporter permease [Coprococcus sp.]